MEFLAQSGWVVLTLGGSILILFLLAKLMGNKQVSQMNLFDYIVGITIGSVAGEMAFSEEVSVRHLVAFVIYGLAAAVISLWTNRSLRTRRAISGKPLILLENGVIYRENLKKARLDLNEFLTYCRIGGWFDLNQLHTAVLEHNGAVSFLSKETDHPATDVNPDLMPKQSQVQIPCVMDGQLLRDNVEKAGKAETWVHRKLTDQGYQDESKVLLALWDGEEKLTVFPMDTRNGKG